LKTVVVNNEKDIPNNSIIIDIDKGIFLLKEFQANVKKHKKKYLKIKNDLEKNKQYISFESYSKFIQKNLKNDFKKIFFEKIFKDKIFENYELDAYIFGIFLLIANENKNFNINKILAKTIQEIALKIYS
jgi:hypothetical protein